MPGLFSFKNLFMKGTHLEQIAHDYSKAQEQQTLLNEEIKRKKAMLRPMETKAKELEEEIEGELAPYSILFVVVCAT